MERDRLYMKTFGGFSLSWNGKAVAGGGKAEESQFGGLMMMLLHRRKEGVSRDEAEAFLFGERELEDVHHAMQSVVYNAKKKLRQAGLPEGNYIGMRDGRFYWTEGVRASEDAEEFEELYRLAEAEKDPDRKLGLYLEACYCYGGEFLPRLTGVLWASREAKKYRGMFASCVESAVPLLRMNRSYLQMEELGRHASRVQPLSDWEVVTMEALAGMERYEEARKLYEDTVSYYFQEEGLRPSRELMGMMKRLGEKMEHAYAVLDDIQEKLSDVGEEAGGGYLCSYPVFQGIYRMVRRMMERGGQSVYLMLCTVVDGKGNPMKEGPMLEGLSERLGDAIRRSVRHSDAVSRYGKGQYLVLLVNTTRENCGIIQKRINYHFIIRRQRTGIQYYVNSVICAPGHGEAGTASKEAKNAEEPKATEAEGLENPKAIEAEESKEELGKLKKVEPGEPKETKAEEVKVEPGKRKEAEPGELKVTEPVKAEGPEKGLEKPGEAKAIEAADPEEGLWNLKGPDETAEAKGDREDG